MELRVKGDMILGAYESCVQIEDQGDITIVSRALPKVNTHPGSITPFCLYPTRVLQIFF